MAVSACFCARSRWISASARLYCSHSHSGLGKYVTLHWSKYGIDPKKKSQNGLLLVSSKARDDGEADTVMVVTDMLDQLFGYDKYSEITAEYSIRGTYCDLATKLDGVLQLLIEVKAIGLDLTDQHVKQAVDYANQGVDWVIRDGIANGWAAAGGESYQSIGRKVLARRALAEPVAP